MLRFKNTKVLDEGWKDKISVHLTVIYFDYLYGLVYAYKQ